MVDEQNSSKGFRRVLGAYDGFPASQRAVELAAESVGKGGHLTLISVAPLASTWMISVSMGPRFDSQAMQKEINATWRKQAEAAASNLPPDLESKVILADGSAPIEIVREIERSEYDLVVLGSRGRGAWGALFLGSVSQHVAHTSSIPVLIVPPRPEDQPEED